VRNKNVLWTHLSSEQEQESRKCGDDNKHSNYVYVYIYIMSLSCLKILVSKARLSSVKEAIAYFYDLPASYNKKLSVSWYSPLPVFLLVISFNIRPSFYVTLSLETRRSCSHYVEETLQVKCCVTYTRRATVRPINNQQSISQLFAIALF